MRRSLLLTFLVVSFFQIHSQGIEFFQGEFEEAFKLAEKEDKLVFVDAYAKWCGPCKRMAREIFPLVEVGDFFNKNFVNLKLDMEEGQGLRFGKKYPVSAYPTFFFIAPDGEVVYKIKGGRDESGFLKEAEKAISSYDRSGQYVEAYEAGNRDHELVLNYVMALNKANKPSLKISNDYLNSQKDITTKENLLFLHEAVVESDSRLFDIYVKHKKKILEHKTQEEFESKVIAACDKTVEKAMEYRSRELLVLAQKHVKKHAKSYLKEFKYRTDFKFAESLQDPVEIVKTAEIYIQKVIQQDVKRSTSMIKHIERNHSENQAMMNIAEDLAAAIANDHKGVTELMNYVRILIKNKEYDKAILISQEAKTIAETKGENTKQIDGTIRYIESLKKRPLN